MSLFSTAHRLDLAGTITPALTRGPTEHDPFPDINFTTVYRTVKAPFWSVSRVPEMSLGTASAKLLYRACVKVLNKKRLHSRTDTPRHDVFNLSDDVKPEVDVQELEDCLQTYSAASSAKVNWGKSGALLCGPWSSTEGPTAAWGLAVLNAPPGLLAEIQRRLVAFFWSGQHWLKAAVGGQGLIDLESRAAAFRLKAAQRLLYHSDLCWKESAHALLRMAGRMGLDRHLFLLNADELDLSGLGDFYTSALKAWRLLKATHEEGIRPTAWVWEEPIHNKMIPLRSVCSTALRRSFLDAGICKLGHLRVSDGSGWITAQYLAQQTGINSQRLLEQFLSEVRQALSKQMDAPSTFFSNLERKNGKSRFIHSLRSEEGQELTETVDVRNVAVRFYSELYRSQYKENGELALSFYAGFPKVSEQLNAELEQPLDVQELHAALQSMEGGTAPGTDGLPIEFYKAFWAELGADWLAVLNETLVEGSLSLSCRRAVITLLPKKGDLQDIKNWRPVSLLCTDLKVFSKALAIRLRDVMGHVIHLDQTYCVPGRTTSDNICLNRNILEVSNILGVDSGLISLDQEKAFDQVGHLWYTLEAFGFSHYFITMVRVLYQDVESVLKINGGLSAPFRAECGIRHGCTLSGMLYSLAIEPLLNRLRSKIGGFALPQHDVQHCISAYADDVMVMINGQADIDNLVSAVRDFGDLSAARVNW
ncbi:hypothetical protein AOLI_G00072170 [Acnodon oligacanthus]